ncbi:MAG: HlyD family efflux transporter periplasmic adaptor subunit [Planctomycetes bacterium]|nr:HlyD family efflux transporter periplasmic adaptor subunit [Planctomycetota bacterium]
MKDDSWYRSNVLGTVLLPVIIVAGGVAMFMLMGSEKKSAADAGSGDAKHTAPMVETESVQAHRPPLVIQADGVAVPFREIELAAEVDGLIVKKAPECRAGKFVTGPAGEIPGLELFKIDPQDYDTEVSRLKMDLNQADAAVNELDGEFANTWSLIDLAERQLTLQEEDYQRAETLHADGVVTDADLEGATRTLLTAENAWLTLFNQMRVLNTRRRRLEWAQDRGQILLDKAQLDLGRTSITAPVNGVVVEDMVEQGDYVRKGTVLAKIEDTSRIEIRCSLQMDDLYWIWDRETASPGLQVQDDPSRGYDLPPCDVDVAYTLAGVEYTWKGKLARYDGIGVDEATRMVPCRIVVDNPRAVQPADRTGPPALVRGMFVTARILAKPQTPLLQVSERAIRPGSKVWRVRDGKLKIVDVRVLQVCESTVTIAAPEGELTADDQVVVSPLAELKDGMAVGRKTKD